MRIVIDMQGAQTESRFRGIGRYTLAFAQAVVKNRGEHEIILALSGLFPDTIEPIRAAFDGLLPQENIRVWHAPGPVNEDLPGNETRREVAELLHEAFLASLQPDVIHISSLFEGYVDDAVTSIDRFDRMTPVSVILYDLIPLLNPDHYLKANPRYEQYYLRKVAFLKQATLLLTISEFSREEVVTELEISEDKVVVLSSIMEGDFYSQNNNVPSSCQRQNAKRFSWDEAAKSAIRAWVGLPQCDNNSADSLKNAVYNRLIEAVATKCDAKNESDLLTLASCIAKNGTESAERQLLVDISSLVQHDHRTGIQRVVRSVLKEWLLHPPEGYRIEPVYATVDQGYRYAKCFRERFMDEPSIETQDEPMDYSPGDVFLGLDLNHHLPVIHQPYLAEMYRNGVEVRFVVYDLLPLQFPEFWPPEHGVHHAHAEWLSVIATLGGAICISKAVADDLAAWIKQNGPKRERPFAIDWFHLGADVEHAHPTRGLPENAATTLAQFSARPTFLMVGTLEPRKGHTQVLDAFDQLWQSGVDVNLAIVGKQGWMVEKLVARLRTHPDANQRLFWLEGISDEYLEKVYATSTCLIAASCGEGFGLPLIEAAQHKLPIIARDIPVFREVVGEYAYYFNATDAQELARSIMEWLVLLSIRQHPDSINMRWATWRQSCRNLEKILVR